MYSLYCVTSCSRAHVCTCLYSEKRVIVCKSTLLQTCMFVCMCVCGVGGEDGWMDGFRFQVRFNSTLVVSVRWVGENDRLCVQWTPINI